MPRNASRGLRVGSRGVRPDAAAKLAGDFAYATGLHAAGELHGATVRGTVASGMLDAVRTDAALRVPGARLVLTAADVPGARHLGLKTADTPVLAIDRVRYAGEPVAFVVAETAEAARRMALLVEPVIRPAEPLLDPFAALEAGAPLVGAESNLVAELELAHGDGVHGAVKVSARWRTGRQDAAFLAPEAGLASPGPDGSVVLDVATQDVHEDRRSIALALGLPPEKVLVRLAGVGGAFGGREDITLHVHLCLAALRTGRPVRAVYGRAESLHAHPHRHPATMDYALSADRAGRLVALDADLLLDGGAYASTSLPISKIVHYFAAGPYRIPSVRVRTRTVHTNNPVSGALRGFGATQACFGIESTIDLLAAELGLDPRELRRRNLLAQGEPLATSRQPLTGTAAPAAVLAALDGVPLPPDAPGRGVGYAIGIKSAGLGDGRPDPAGIGLRLDATGLTVRSAAAEVGQGIGAVLARIVGSHFPDVPVRLAESTTGLPVAGGSKASRQSMASGGAADLACRDLLARLNGLAEARGLPDWRSVGLPELLDGAVLTAEAVNPGLPTQETDARTGTGHLHQAFQLTAHRAVVDVDPELGTARLVQLVAAQDVGRAIDPVGVRGQLVGGSVQGAGFALFEEIPVDGEGRPRAKGFGDYLLPLASDVPEVIAVPLEHADDRLAFGAKGIGEGPLVSSPAAVAAALRAADGSPVDRVPAYRLAPSPPGEDAERRAGDDPGPGVVLRPTSWTEAAALLRAHPDATVLAGGTALLPRFNTGGLRPSTVILLSGISPEPPRIGDGRIRFDARTTVGEARTVARCLPEDLGWFGTPAVRRRATVVGNLLAAEGGRRDLAVPLLAVDAVLLTPEGDVGLDEVLDGAAPGLVTAIETDVPRRLGYARTGVRPSVAPPEAAVAIAWLPRPPGADRVRVVARLRAARPERLRDAERLLERRAPLDEVAAACTGHARPFGVLARRILEETP
ncbi:CO/xanthine dehydrogenase Mo-binding subunit [Actinocorallia herbida]|uniref:CO/xanthine dehydrogenase Mo-binding subunit n=1 Tax=Actinocorallia herbida TaxID=58109 RepID=A0A3N1CZD9_9ACTN|nr:molybdopterin cofactor-binding domain-containing protein [Actinocorallia herbida]ROO86654.1 CO/xanthine dehydrogenase Mo-binding subunit [Actinocorallia herbida]